MCSRRRKRDPDLSGKDFLERLACCPNLTELEKYHKLRDARKEGNGRITNELLKQFYEKAKAEHVENEKKRKKKLDEEVAKARKMREAARKKQDEYYKAASKNPGYGVYKKKKELSLNSAYEKEKKAAKSKSGMSVCSVSRAI